MKVINQKNHYQKGCKRSRFEGISFQPGSGQHDTHGYSYLLCREMMQELGDIMGFDNPQFPVIQDCLLGEKLHALYRLVEDDEGSVRVPYCRLQLDACPHKGQDILDGSGDFVCEKVLSREYFTWDVKESLLMIDRKGRCFFLFTFSKEVTATEQNIDSQSNVLGIDLGVNNLAVCSDGRFYNSAKVKQTKRKFKYLRSKLQAKGTRSSKRLLKKISGREKRFMAWCNHNISKDIVSKFNGNKIVMENLKGIRKQRKGKRMNWVLSNWSFFQLQSFIQYKAERKGVVVNRVKPNYTSQICHRCGQLGSRSSQGCFSCHCGLSNYSADLNASRNLAHPMLVERQGAVTHPNIQSDDVKSNSQVAIATEFMDNQSESVKPHTSV